MSSPLPRFHDFSLSAEAIEQLRRELKALSIYDLTKRFDEYRRACEVTDDMPTTDRMQRLVTAWRVMRARRTHDER
ncbi:MAG TPA: hypothetical protein VFB63_27950 [Bryobacteraceae bacterium]|nr:hypothetical protein [Bryobacteraceae bacterium]